MGLCCSRSRKPNYDDDNHLAGGNVQLITSMEMWEETTAQANKDGKVVVVNFSAVWCNPCRQISSVYRELADKYSSILFLSVDVDDLSEFSAQWDIKATPTFFFLGNGRKLDKLVGADKEGLQKKVTAIAADQLSNAKSRD